MFELQVTIGERTGDGKFQITKTFNSFDQLAVAYHGLAAVLIDSTAFICRLTIKPNIVAPDALEEKDEV